MMPRRPRLAVIALTASLLSACHDSTGPGVDLRYASIAAGNGFTCALTRDGRAFCWGNGLYGQLGRIVDSVYTSAPIPVAGGHRFAALATGTAHVCGLATDGSAWCWGLNSGGQLGAASTTCSTVFTAFDCAAVPVQVQAGAPFTSIAAAGNTSCAVTEAGAVWCWGWIPYYISDSRSSSPHVLVDSTGSAFTSIAITNDALCGVTSKSRVRCWGDNWNGVLGLGVLGGNASQPTLTADTVRRSAIAANWAPGYEDYVVCALSLDGHASCWGGSTWGALGSSGTVQANAPLEVDFPGTFTAISVGTAHACGIASDGNAWCWGSDSLGMLGHNTVAPTCASPFAASPCQETPVQVADADAPYVSISAGVLHSCAVSRAGAAWCWGRNDFGELGTGTVTGSRVPVQVLAADTAR